MATDDLGAVMESVAIRAALRSSMRDLKERAGRLQRDNDLLVEASCGALERSYALIAKLNADAAKTRDKMAP